MLNVIIGGWEHPTTQDIDRKITPKPEISWIKEKNEASLRNSRALKALFNGVDQNVFKLIYTCSSTKEAWNILKTVYEGTSKVKISRLYILSSNFEDLKMAEDETIVEFNVRVLDLNNESLLWEKNSPILN